MASCGTLDLTTCEVKRTLWLIIPLSLLVIGTCGNILNMILLSRRNMRKISISVYLLCLSGADFTFLWTTMFPRMVLEVYNSDIKAQSLFTCKVVSWLSITSTGCSIWILVVMTIERVLAIKLPLLARMKFTRKTSLIAALTTLFICTSLTAQILVVYGVKTIVVNDPNGNATITKRQCAFISDDVTTFHKFVWPSIILVLLTIIPMLTIILGNLTIVIESVTKRKRVNPLSNMEGINSTRKAKSVTKTLVLVSTFFVVTTLPFTLGNVFLSRQTSNDPAHEAMRQLTYTILRHLLYCNFTFNFVIYFMSGSLFKQEFKSFINDTRMTLVSLLDVRHAQRNEVTVPHSNISNSGTRQQSSR